MFDFQCENGCVNTHRLILSSISPFMKQVLSEADQSGNDDTPTILLPDVKKEEITRLLCILYSGCLNLYKRSVKILYFLFHFSPMIIVI